MTARAGRLAAELREQARVTAASQARELRLVAALSREVEAAARRELAEGPRVPGQPADQEVIADAIEAEVAAVLGVSGAWAAHLGDVAERLCRVLPDTLAALEAGRLDFIRARRLADATESLPDEVARRVEEQVLAGCGDAPWSGPTPRTWRDRVDRAIVRLAPDVVRERRRQALADRAVRAWPDRDGTGILRVTADQVDIAMADEVINDLAMQWPEIDPRDPAAGKRSMDQRRVDSLMDLFRRVRDGQHLPSLPVRREHDIGLVVSADTYFCGMSPAAPPVPEPGAGPGRGSRPGSGPGSGLEPVADPRSGSRPMPGHGDGRTDVDAAEQRADESSAPPGQLRRLGTTSYLDPVSAGELARRQVAFGASTTVFLATGQGVLAGAVRLPAPKGGAWTPEGLRSAIYRRLERHGPLPPDTDTYSPTRRQIAFVRARNARCTAYDCARVATRCDLDHDTPWPRGPTSVHNLAPRCRRHHESKTRGLVHTELLPDGTVISTGLTGLTQTTRVEPLPGYGPGERRPMPLDPGAAGDAAA